MAKKEVEISNVVKEMKLGKLPQKLYVESRHLHDLPSGKRRVVNRSLVSTKSNSTYELEPVATALVDSSVVNVNLSSIAPMEGHSLDHEFDAPSSELENNDELTENLNMSSASHFEKVKKTSIMDDDDDRSDVDTRLDIGGDINWDTDLETEEKVTEEVYDHSGKSLYIKLCHKAGIVPAGYFLRHMEESVLDMGHHGLGVHGIKPICESLSNNTKVTSLNLTDNWLGELGGMAVAEMLRENCFITEINLADNRLGPGLAQILAEVITSNAQLTRVTLRGNEFDDQSALFFAEMLHIVPRLQYFNMAQNKLGEMAGIAFGKALAENSTLIELDLSWNNIRGKGCKALADGLAQNCTLRVLNLGFNAFGPTYGMQEMGKALKFNSVLEELVLSNNRVSAEGAVLFGKGLTLNSTLKVLSVGRNPMQTAGCYAILCAVLKNPESAINSLDFEDILVNEDFKELHKQALETMPNLQVHIGLRVTVRAKTRTHPMMKLKNYVEKQGLRLIDFFNTFDKDGSMSVTRQEFLDGLEEYRKTAGLNLTDEEIDWLLADLDKDGDGEIDYSEMVSGHQEFQEMEKRQIAMNSTILN